jgi:hypothetical protein
MKKKSEKNKGNLPINDEIGIIYKVSSGSVEGFNLKAKLTMKKSVWI